MLIRDLKIQTVIKRAGLGEGLMARWLNQGGNPKRESAIAILTGLRDVSNELQLTASLIDEAVLQIQDRGCNTSVFMRAFCDAAGENKPEAATLLDALIWTLTKNARKPRATIPLRKTAMKPQRALGQTALHAKG
ncbi:MAG: hypothetical protein ACRCXD_14565 [Luteolibacter sp.]